MPDDKPTQSLDALAVFTHPDDAELIAAGTLLKLKAQGYRTGVLDMTRGEMGTRGTVEGRAEESRLAAEILKLDVRENLGLPDGHVHATEEARTRLVRFLRAHEPKILLTHHRDDPHPDHAAVSNIVRQAARLSSMRRYDEGSNKRPDGSAMKVPIVAYSIHSRLTVPSFIIDISEHLEGKMNSIRAHSSQFFSSNSTEPATRISAETFLNEIEIRARYYGSLIGVAAGEPYLVREALNINDPVALLTRPMNIYS